MQLIEHLEITTQPNIQPKYVIIWLHGLGADNNDFAPFASQLTLNHPIKFVFPNADIREVEVNNNQPTRAWYNVRFSDFLGDTVDKEGLFNSISQIESLIAEQISQGFYSEQIILGGFSQGGVLTHAMAIFSQYKLGGFIALSCYLPNALVEDESTISLSKNLSTPILTCHGTNDPTVPYIGGVMAFNRLKPYFNNIIWQEYPIEHTVSVEELQDINHYINNTLLKAS